MSGFPEPRGGSAEPGALFARYLEYYRDTVIRKVSSLGEDERRRSRLPSGWSPIELVNHLAYMERRWFVWGFLGEHVDEPWGDHEGDRWHLAADVPLDVPVAMLREVGRRTTELLASHSLHEVAPPGPRFEQEPPALAWICLHVLQEYARHAGHLDIAVELAGGELGE